MYEFGIESEVEIEVADILVNLGAIIMESESRYIDNTNPPLAWGGKRKRSIPPSQGNNNKVKTEEAAASPNTPLCFAPSECDEKPKGLLPGQTCSNNKKVLYYSPLLFSWILLAPLCLNLYICVCIHTCISMTMI